MLVANALRWGLESKTAGHACFVLDTLELNLGRGARGKKSKRCQDAQVLTNACAACAPQVAVIINDRVDVAIAVGAEGAHIGQEDLPAARARALLGPHRLLGVSCKTVEQALAAEAAGADYLGCGARAHPALLWHLPS
jgi:thiamine-phosphate diphosphorylase